MSLPRPASPKALVADIRALLGSRSPHQWIAAALAIAVPAFIVTAFYFELQKTAKPPTKIIYVQSFSADRTDADIIADQKKAQVEKEAAAKERQRQFQKLADSLGIK